MSTNKKFCYQKITIQEARIRILAYKHLASCFDSMQSLVSVMDYKEEVRDFMREYVKDLQNDLSAHRYVLLKQIDMLE